MSDDDAVRYRSNSVWTFQPSLSGGDKLYPVATYTDWFQNKPASSVKTVWNWIATNETNECFDHTNPRRFGHYIGGGGLTVKHYYHTASPQEVSYFSGTRQSGQQFEGTIFPCFVGAANNLPLTGVLPDDAFGDVSSYGPKAWNQFKPGKPEVDLAVAIAELRDFPQLFKFRLDHFKDLGSNYLNVQFGWLPFLSDLRKFLDLTKNVHQKLDGIRRANGKWLLRRGSVTCSRDQLGSWEVTGQCPFSPSLPGFMLGTSPYTASGTSFMERNVWFSGRFRYYIPDIDDESGLWLSGWKRETMRKLYGLTISPSVVYELIPWSWLVDYFCNAGDVISNISGGAVDCVAKYAYVMGTTKHTSSQSGTARLKDGSILHGVVAREAVRKHRCSANPFGFGLTDGSLSARQLAILTALGISRS